jgi:hypothetical protein
LIPAIPPQAWGFGGEYWTSITWFDAAVLTAAGFDRTGAVHNGLAVAIASAPATPSTPIAPSAIAFFILLIVCPFRLGPLGARRSLNTAPAPDYIPDDRRLDSKIDLDLPVWQASLIVSRERLERQPIRINNA